MDINVSEIISTVADNNNITQEEVVNLINHYERTIKKEIETANIKSEESFLKEGKFITNTKIYIPNLGTFLSNTPRTKILVKLLADKS